MYIEYFNTHMKKEVCFQELIWSNISGHTVGLVQNPKKNKH